MACHRDSSVINDQPAKRRDKYFILKYPTKGKPDSLNHFAYDLYFERDNSSTLLWSPYLISDSQ